MPTDASSGACTGSKQSWSACSSRWPSSARPRRAVERALSDRAGGRRARARLRPRAAERGARARARARHLPAAAAVLGGLLRQPARPPARHALDLAAGGRARARRRCASSPSSPTSSSTGSRGRPPSRSARSWRRPTRSRRRRSRAASGRRAASSRSCEGESLINDGTALVAYRAAVRGGGRRASRCSRRALEFVLGAAGGVLIGLVVGLGDLRDPPAARRRARGDHDLAAERLRGLPARRGAWARRACWRPSRSASSSAGARRGSPRARMRLQGYAVWEILIFLLNALLFVLIGLQLPLILDDLAGQPSGDAARPGGGGQRRRDPHADRLAEHDAVPDPRDRPAPAAARAPGGLALPDDRRVVGDARRGVARRRPGAARRLPAAQRDPAAHLRRHLHARSCSRASRCRR